MVSLGLRDAGYIYVNTDDGWLETNRTADGHLQPALNLFPQGSASLKNLSDHIHAHGLKFGIYNSNSLTTCMSKAGGLYNERIDAATYAAWGVDYVKYDLCGQGNLQPFVTFQVMRDALNSTGRPMLYSCEPQQLRGNPIEWPPYVANMFRIAADMGPYYGDFTGDALLSNAWVNVAEVGGWTDSGYMEVGNMPSMVNTSLSRTQFALWCILKTNLLIAADIRKMNASNPYLQVLLNKELIAISQDPLGHIGRLVALQMAMPAGRDVPPLFLPKSTSASALAASPSAAAHDESPSMPLPWPGAVAGVGVTDCILKASNVKAEQQWVLGSAGDGSLSRAKNCLTIDSLSSTGGGVILSPCNGSTLQQWSSSRNNASSVPLGEIALTIAPIVKTNTSVIINGTAVPLCLATNGSSLFVEACIFDPPTCNATRCAQRIENSPRWRQLWYFGTTGQVMSTYTSTPGPDSELLPCGPPLHNIPKCLATVPNSNPPTPPEPPALSAGQAQAHQLQIWAAKMSGGRRAVALVNAFDRQKVGKPGWVWGAANITAHWRDLWLADETVMDVRDALYHRNLGQATGSISMAVDVYDVAVLILTPVVVDVYI